MIRLHGVTDAPHLFGSQQPLLLDAHLEIPPGRYALLSRSPEVHRPLIDILAGLRPPRLGTVQHLGHVSWPVGRQGFVRGKVSGRSMIAFTCARYGIEFGPCFELVADLLTKPAHLDRPMEDWPIETRQEFTFALALAPAFDVYVVDAAMPFERRRFTRLWSALFEERLVGRSLILSTYRQNQLGDYCTRGLIYERNALRIDDDLDECIRRFPPRRPRIDASDTSPGTAVSEAAGGQFDA